VPWGCCPPVGSACVDADGPCAGEYVQAEVAAAFDPFVVLLGQHGTDQPDDRGAVGEDADHIGSATDFVVQAFLWIVARDLASDLLGEGGERQQIRPCRIEVLGHSR
jgi:hypothetical protein